MRRRELFKLIGGAVVAWPLAGRAQPPNMPVVGFLNDGIAQHDYDLAASFRQGLREAGFDAGQNVAIVERWADGQYGRLSDLTADLIDRKVSVIAAAFIQASLSARAGAGTTPVVFVTGSDPVRYGLVSSLNKPGGFTTGITTFNNVMGGKRLGLLRDLVPGLRTFAVLINPKQPEGQESYLEDLQSAARALGMSLIALPASTDGDIDEAFAAMVNQKIGALLVMPDSFLSGRLNNIVTLAARHAIPTIYARPEAVPLGGLMSYATDLVDVFREQGTYVGRILKGEKPADLPVLQPTNFKFLLNLKTAKALGLTIPSGMLAIADKVIE